MSTERHAQGLANSWAARERDAYRRLLREAEVEQERAELRVIVAESAVWRAQRVAAFACAVAWACAAMVGLIVLALVIHENLLP